MNKTPDFVVSACMCLLAITLIKTMNQLWSYYLVEGVEERLDINVRQYGFEFAK